MRSALAAFTCETMHKILNAQSAPQKSEPSRITSVPFSAPARNHLPPMQ
jgi:hypothetical protein